MNDNQTEQLTSYRALSGVFANHEAKIDTFPKLKEKVARFKAYLLSINKEAINSGNDVVGITASKDETKKAMAELAVRNWPSATSRPLQPKEQKA